MAQQSTTSGKRWLSRSGGASWAVGWLSLILLAWVGHPHRVQAAAGAGPQLPDGVAEVQGNQAGEGVDRVDGDAGA